MGVALTNPTNGQTLSGSTLTTETKKIENFVNGGVVVGDIAAATLRKPHMYRPDSDGFPAERSHEIQSALVNRTVRDHWDPRQQTNRFDVVRAQIGDGAAVAIGPGCSATVEHYGGTRDYVVRCWFGAKAMPEAIGASPHNLVLRMRGTVVLKHRTPAGTVTTYAASRRQIEPGIYSSGGIFYPARLRTLARYTQAVFALTADGAHDFWLEYQFTSTNEDEFRAVVFCQRGLKISAHKG